MLGQRTRLQWGVTVVGPRAAGKEHPVLLHRQAALSQRRGRHGLRGADSAHACGRRRRRPARCGARAPARTSQEPRGSDTNRPGRERVHRVRPRHHGRGMRLAHPPWEKKVRGYCSWVGSRRASSTASTIRASFRCPKRASRRNGRITPGWTPSAAASSRISTSPTRRGALRSRRITVLCRSWIATWAKYCHRCTTRAGRAVAQLPCATRPDLRPDRDRPPCQGRPGRADRPARRARSDRRERRLWRHARARSQGEIRMT